MGITILRILLCWVAFPFVLYGWVLSRVAFAVDAAWDAIVIEENNSIGKKVRAEMLSESSESLMRVVRGAIGLRSKSGAEPRP